MPLAPTLEKVKEDFRRGDFGKASARLHGLIGSYPDHLELRKQLGDAYWNLHMPEMAGRYWYLVENKDGPMLAACRLFEQRFRNDPWEILFALKFRGDAEAIKDDFPGRVLDDLQRRASEKYTFYPDFQKNGLSQYWRKKKRGRRHGIRDLILQFGCLIGALLVMALAIIGFFTLIGTTAKWLQ